MNDIIELIKASNNILITTHVSPDGDTTGSALAFGLALGQMGKKVKIAFEQFPKFCNFLPGQDVVINYLDVTISQYDIVIMLDTASPDRVCVDIDILRKIKTINIDHHISNTKFGDLNYINPKAAATTEIVYEFIKQLNLEVNKEIAECLYTGLATDTGGFKYSNTTNETHKMAGELLNKGIDVANISQILFNRKSLKQVKIIAKALNSLEMHLNNKVAIVKVYKSFLEEVDVTLQECESIVDYARDIEGVFVGLALKQVDEKTVKVSFRSNKIVNVATLAMKFNGGGHEKAAGCTIKGTMEEVQKNLLTEIEKLL